MKHPISVSTKPAAAHVTILEGDPGIGKSFLAMHIAAQVSVGGRLPGSGRTVAGEVLYLTAEDDPSYTVRPRIEAMGGDVSRVRIHDGVLTLNDMGMQRLANHLRRHPTELVVIDTFLGFVPVGADASKATDMRHVLHALGRLARDHNTTILLMRHWTKSGRGKALYRGGGSIDIMAVARSAIAVAVHPGDTDRRVLAHVKHNLTEAGASRIFDLVSKPGIWVPVVKWGETTTLTADDLESPDVPSRSDLDIACEFLRTELTGQSIPAAILQQRAEARSISKRTLERAKALLKIRSEKQGSGWLWSLSAEATTLEIDRGKGKSSKPEGRT